jgi:hypothetical protein
MLPFNSSNSPHHKITEKRQNNLSGNKLLRLLFPIIGIASLIWMLIRIIPKPSRAQYPCMKVAAPFASSFIAYLAGLAVAVVLFKKAGRYFNKSKYFLSTVFILTGLILCTATIFKTDNEIHASNITGDSLFVPSDPPNSPIGTAKGIFPGRVVWMWDPAATKWNGTSNYWWSETNTIQSVVDSMLSKSVRAITGESTDAEAWYTLFKYFNESHGKGNIGYHEGEKIAIKLSLVQCTNSSINGGNNNFSTPQLVLALLRQLVHNAGIPENYITFYDIMRSIPSSITDKCKSEFPKVHFVGSIAGYNQEAYKRDTTKLNWSQNLVLEHPTGGLHTGYLPTIVTKASYLINFANLKGHRYVGVTGCAKNHFGSMSADGDVNTPHSVGVHPYVTVHDFIINGSDEWSFLGRPMGTYNALVDLMGNKDLGGKTLLYMTDGLYVVPVENDPNTMAIRFQQPPFNNRWTSSIFISQDEVALESVIIDFLRNEQALNNKLTQVFPDNSAHKVVIGNVDNYLHEAALANDPPSGTIYHPSGDGVRLKSLGVHEHWNNYVDKQYSRNLGTGNGIELYQVHNPATDVKRERIPSGFVLSQNYPNPFNPSTVIGYQLPIGNYVSLKVYNAVGKEIITLVNQEKPAGAYLVQFNAKNLPSGIYYYQLKAGKFTETKKFILLK